MTQPQLGATESRSNTNTTYLSLRTGKLTEVYSPKLHGEGLGEEVAKGFKLHTTENASGTQYKFYAKTYDDLVGYIKDLRWHEFEWQEKKITGWNLHIDTRDGREWVLQINSTDRPFQTLMQVLPGVDFTQPVRIVAFMGKNQKTGGPQKVLLFTQNFDSTAKDWIKPTLQAKWLSQDLVKKIKAKEKLDEKDRANIHYDEDGKPNWNYPYIKQLRDGSWSFDEWTDHLQGVMYEEVIPEIQAAAAERGEIEPADDTPEFSGGTIETDDDDFLGGDDEDGSGIPF